MQQFPVELLVWVDLRYRVPLYLSCYKLLKFAAKGFYAIDLYLNSQVTSLLSTAGLKHPRTPPSNTPVDYPSGDSDHVLKRRAIGISDEVPLFEF